MEELVPAPFAHYPPRPGAHRIRLCGGPLDGFEVGLVGALPRALRVNGPRHGNHTIWITHRYTRCGDAYVHEHTEVVDVRSYC